MGGHLPVGGAGPIALIQTAATLPAFLLTIPAGVLSDILDRRPFLDAIQISLGCVRLSLMTLATRDEDQRACARRFDLPWQGRCRVDDTRPDRSSGLNW